MLAVGSGKFYDEHNHVESYAFDGQKWTQVADFPFYDEIGWTTVVDYKNSFYTFGGLVGFYAIGDITRYDVSSNEWALIGQLQERVELNFNFFVLPVVCYFPCKESS